MCAFYFLVVVMLLGSATSSWASTVTATWNPNPETDIAGYKLSYGTSSGNYTTTIDVGNVTSYVLTLPGGQMYYFVVQAYDVTGLLSPRSTEVAFNVPASAGPTLTNLSPSSGPVGTSVTIAGSNFGATKGTSTITFNGTAAVPTSWSATSIVVPVPAGAISGNVVVTVGGLASPPVPFMINPGVPTGIRLVPQ